MPMEASRSPIYPRPSGRRRSDGISLRVKSAVGAGLYELRREQISSTRLPLDP